MPLSPGEQVGPFHVVEQIGAGGAAIVYKAHDPLLDRDVAVKLIADAHADRATVRREAAAHKTLTQDKPDLLVQLIDVVEDPRGIMLISEFVEGESLEQRLTRRVGPMSESRAVRILAQVAGALYVVHKRGMVHRDVKPANVLLADNDRVKLADFGLTVALADQRAMDAGTVRYMAPELLRGEPADARADLYALGVLAYEMLAGRQKFDEAFAPVLRDRRNAAMRWVKWHTNPRTTAPPLTGLNPQVNPRLAELVARLMDKDPQRRVGSAEELLSALRRVHHATGGDTQADIPAAPAPVTTPGDTAPLPRASRGRGVAVWIAGFVVLATLAGGGYYLWDQHAAEQARQQAHAQAMTDAQRALDTGEFDAAEAQYGRILQTHPDDAVARRNHLLARGQAALAAGRFDAAVDDFEAALALDAGRQSELNELITQTRQRQAFAEAVGQIEARVEAGRFDDAQQMLAQWQPLAQGDAETAQLDAWRQVIADRRVRVAAEATVARARELAGQGRVGEAIALLEPAASQYSSHRGLREYLTELTEQRDYDAAVASARAAEAAGDTAAALAGYRNAARLRPSDELQSRLDTLESNAYLEQGLDRLRVGDLAEAERLFILALGRDEANDRAREALGRMESVNQAQGFVTAGDAAMAERDFDAAVRHFENAAKLSGDEWITSRLHEARVRKLLHEADAAMNEGEAVRAGALIEEARRISPGHALIADAEAQMRTRGEYFRQLALADAARDRSDFAAAKTGYRKAQQVLDTEEVRRRMDDAEYAQSIAQARAYIDRNEPASALAMLRIALQIRDTEQVRAMIQEVEGKE